MARTFVIGVGMTKFDKPGTKEGDYPGLGAGGRRARRSPTPGIAYDADRAGLRRLLLRRLDRRPARGLRARPHRHPGRQRQQQLLDRLDARSSSRARRSRAASPTARSRSASRRWRTARSASKFTDRTNPMDKHVDGAARAARAGRTRRPRRRCSATPGASTWRSTAPTPEHFAWIGWKNHKHSVNNPYAQFQDEYTLDEIKERARRSTRR